MQINLTPEESEKIFYDVMCSGFGYLADYGFSLDYSTEEYRRAKAALTAADKDICREDIYMELLRQGGSLRFIDRALDGEYNTSIVLQDVHERVKNSPPKRIIEMVEENGDAETADVILQTVLFGEVTFG